MISSRTPKLIAIVGGSGSGKSWLADRLQQAIGLDVIRLSLDDFYKDRSHLPPSRRGRINFDHPDAIDWPLIESVLRDCRIGRIIQVPRYCFATHTRLEQTEIRMPAPLVLVDGLWLLLFPGFRRLFDWSIYIDCPALLRLYRRLARDIAERGRTPESVREQFWKTVSPMHNRFVAPQVQWADFVINRPANESDVRNLSQGLRMLASGTAGAESHQKLLAALSSLSENPTIRQPAASISFN